MSACRYIFIMNGPYSSTVAWYELSLKYWNDGYTRKQSWKKARLETMQCLMSKKWGGYYRRKIQRKEFEDAWTRKRLRWMNRNQNKNLSPEELFVSHAYVDNTMIWYNLIGHFYVNYNKIIRILGKAKYVLMMELP